MYEQIREDTVYIMLYTVATAMAMMASCYLLFRRGNAFAADITPPVRLRQWTAVFFAVFVLNHLWYMQMFFLTSSNDMQMVNLIGGLLDSITFFPLSIIILFAMLQDRRRPLWPAFAMVAPIVVGMAWCVVSRNLVLVPMIFTYLLFMSIGLIVYMVRALKQYGRWLRDNYADLEHKELWQSFTVLVFMLLVFYVYAVCTHSIVYEYVLQLTVVVLICYLLWRVETLSDLSIPALDAEEAGTTEQKVVTEEEEGNNVFPTMRDNIGPLLQHYCIDTQLYLQYDLTLSQLAKAIGTNRYYLSRYFSSQGMTYNAYINDLRVKHFVSLYREAVNSRRSITAQQLAQESGCRSYSTFSCIIKRKTGKSVTAWMKGLNEGLGAP